jgi:UDP-2,4-diacetamido-2,4,6-trideoxy-beta-L-altropyranose hydrolase
MNQTQHQAHITLRRATLDDVMLYFEWANDPDVRKNSFSQEPIALEAHKIWFAKKLNDENAVLYVLEVDGVAAGQIRFDLKNDDAEIGFSIAQKFRGKGLGSTILRYSCAALWREKGTSLSISGVVKTVNTASNRAFERVGFSKSSTSTESTTYYIIRYE